MVRINQGSKSLTAFHDEIHQALTLIQQKIGMADKNMRSGRQSDANEDAIHTFIMGLRSNYTRGILYPNETKKKEYKVIVLFSEGKQKKVKKNKMTKLDARILGFSVTAAEARINVGDRDYVDGPQAKCVRMFCDFKQRKTI